MHCENMVWFGFSCLSWESAGPAPLDYPDDTEMTDSLKAIQGPCSPLETADLNQPFSLPTSRSVTDLQLGAIIATIPPSWQSSAIARTAYVPGAMAILLMALEDNSYARG